MTARPQATGDDELQDLFVGFLQIVKGEKYHSTAGFRYASENFSGASVFKEDCLL